MRVVIGDCKYRMAIAAAQNLAKFHDVTLFSKEENVPAFAVKNTKNATTNDILALGDEKDKPGLLPIDVKTIELINANREEFEKKFNFLLADASTLDKLNDKNFVARRAARLEIATPKHYKMGDDIKFPVVIKYNCGEKLNKKAGERYEIVENHEQLDACYGHFKMDGKEPIIQEYIAGRGIGVSILMGKNQELLSYICHERRREYPATGGPSTLCVSRYFPELISRAVELLKSVGFVGMAMVEFRGTSGAYRLLEVNPRVWGTFPLIHKAKSAFLHQYFRHENCNLADISRPSYQVGVKMRFLFNDLLAGFDYIKLGKIKKGFGAFVDLFNFKIKDGVFEKGERKANAAYMRSLWKK